MPVITNTFKSQVLGDLFADFADSANTTYYIGIGRSEGWGDSADTAVTPRTTERDTRNARLSLQSVKEVQDLSYVVQRRQWATGLVYYAYDDNDVGYDPDQPFYVINSNQEVYICLKQGKAADGTARASDQQPTGNTGGSPFSLSDGYTWKFLYSIGALRASKFLSSSYMPVQKVISTDSDSPAEEIQQKTVQDAAVAGQIANFVVTDGGSGYTTVPTVSLTGNGSGATAVAVVSGNEVVEVKVTADSVGSYGTGYDYADVTISGGGGTGAKARAVISPEGGFGADPRNDLRSSALMFNAKIDGDEDSDFTLGADIYRQVTLLKNLQVEDSADAPRLDATTGIGLKKMVHDQSWTSDDILKKIVVGSTSGAEAYIDKLNENTQEVWYHQTEDTGFVDFADGETITIQGTALSGTIQNLYDGDFSPMTGDLLYIDNRSPVNRLSDQEDDLKIVITL